MHNVSERVPEKVPVVACFGNHASGTEVKNPYDTIMALDEQSV